MADPSVWQPASQIVPVWSLIEWSMAVFDATEPDAVNQAKCYIFVTFKSENVCVCVCVAHVHRWDWVSVCHSVVWEQPQVSVLPYLVWHIVLSSLLLNHVSRPKGFWGPELRTVHPAVILHNWQYSEPSGQSLPTSQRSIPHPGLELCLFVGIAVNT